MDAAPRERKRAGWSSAVRRLLACGRDAMPPRTATRVGEPYAGFYAAYRRNAVNGIGGNAMSR
jgi:hypothetical protein